MTRSHKAIALALLVTACSSSKPAARSGGSGSYSTWEPPAKPQPVAVRPADVDPTKDPTIVGAIDEAVAQGSAEGANAVKTGRRLGRVAGVLAAVFGGPEEESIDDMVDRYRKTRDAVVITSAVVGATKGAVEGAEHGYELDVQFAELLKIDGLQATRPYPDQIDLTILDTPTPEMLNSIAAVLAGREPRAIEIESAGDAALDLRESLIDLGIPTTSLSTHRNDTINGIVLHIHYRD